MTKNNLVLLHLALIPGIGPRTVFGLLASLCGVSNDDFMRSTVDSAVDLSQLYQYGASDFKKHGLSQSIAQNLVDGLASTDDLNRESVNMEKNGIRWISFFDSEYPDLLRHIHAPPIGLFVKGGSIHNQVMHCGVVGSRMSGSYADRVIDILVAPFIVSGGIVVSGGALGVDGKAHRAAVQQGRQTLVVLGSGLLSLYPRQHIPLFNEVLAAGGSLISPFSSRTGPDRFNFPVRNRIIAGMSHATLVVQAAEKSGALITAEYALQEGRSVMAVPGPIDDPLSAGCHKLLKQGACLVTSYEDLCQELDIDVDKTTSVVVEPVLQKTEDPLLNVLRVPYHVESLAVHLNQTLDDIEDRLFALQLEGVVVQRIDGSWVKA